MKEPLRDGWIWPARFTKHYEKLCLGFTLHVCSGKSNLGDIKVDLYEKCDVKADMFHLPFKNLSFDTVISDPPWNLMVANFRGIYFLYECERIARKRIIVICGGMIIIWKLKYWDLEVYIQKRTAGPLGNLILVYDRGYGLIE